MPKTLSAFKINKLRIFWSTEHSTAPENVRFSDRRQQAGMFLEGGSSVSLRVAGLSYGQNDLPGHMGALMVGTGNFQLHAPLSRIDLANSAA